MYTQEKMGRNLVEVSLALWRSLWLAITYLHQVRRTYRYFRHCYEQKNHEVVTGREIVSASFSQCVAETGVQSSERLQIITGTSIRGLIKLFTCLSKATDGVGRQTSTNNYLTDISSHLKARQVWNVELADLSIPFQAAKPIRQTSTPCIAPPTGR